jgi:spore coat polysaccharide biosynthesis predicted glycosyltransferase SpsG
VRGGVLVVDSYTLSPDELERATESSRLVVMHDHGDMPRGAALIVAPAREKSQDAPARLDSLGHVALRPGFWGLPRRQLEDHVDQILVTTGSGKFDLLGQDIARTLAGALPGAEVTIVRGPYASSTSPPRGINQLDAPETLVEALLACDLAVTAGGQTMLEAAAAGTPCLALPLVDDQRRQVASLARLGAVRVVDPPSADDAAAAAVALARDADQRRDLSRRSQQAIDGYGALRVAFHVERLARRA